MQITMFSILMMVFWSSVLILIMALLRRHYHFMDICGAPGMVVLHLFCFLRMMVPVEFPWTVVVPLPFIYNKIYRLLNYEIVFPIVGDMQWMNFFVIIWILVGIVLFVRLIIQRSRAYQTLKALNLKYDDCINILKETEIYSNRLNVKVYRSSLVTTPIATGIRRKIIILPNQKYNAEELNYVLMHEYMHHKNKDLLTELMVDMICIFYWWNPVVYLLKIQLEEYFEMRCDWHVVKHLDNDQVADYLNVILYTITKHEEKVNLFSVKDRFKVIQKETDKNYHNPGILASIILSVLIGIISYSFIFQSQFEPSDKAAGADGYEVNNENSYIYYDGTDYYLYTEGQKSIKLSDKYVEYLLNQNMEIRKAK